MVSDREFQINIEELNELRRKYKYGDNISQAEIDSEVAKWEQYRDYLRPKENTEPFTLVSKNGSFTNLVAPRWLCHLLSLRHKSVHVLLKWHSPSLGYVFILQVRSWTKSDSPGRLDISIGGHVTGSMDVTKSAYREMEEELGLTKADLKNEGLILVTGYESNDDHREQEHFHNTEWRDVYIGELYSSALEKIRFSDHEVVGLYLCPEHEAGNLLTQSIIPIASALKHSLPFCI